MPSDHRQVGLLAYDRQIGVTLHNIQIDLRNTFMLLVLCTIQLNSAMYYALIFGQLLQHTCRMGGDRIKEKGIWWRKFREEGTEAKNAKGREN